MTPTIKQLEEFKVFLLKQNLVEYVKDYLTANESAVRNNVDFPDNITSFDSIEICGDYEYDDQSSYYFSTRGAVLRYPGLDTDFKSSDFECDWKFNDGLSNFNDLVPEISWYTENTIVNVDEISCPFTLEVIEKT